MTTDPAKPDPFEAAAAIIKAAADATPAIANDDQPPADMPPGARPKQPSPASKTKAKRGAVPRGQVSDCDGCPPGPDSITFPDGYAMVEGRGLFYTPPREGGPPVFVSGPFIILGQGRNSEGQGWCLILEFEDPDGVLKSVEVPNADLVSEPTIVLRRLAEEGLRIAATRQGRDKLAFFLSAVQVGPRVDVAEVVGWHGPVFVLPKRVIGGTRPVFLKKHARGGLFESSGDLAAWQKWVARDVEPHDLLVFNLAAGLSAPLVRLAGVEPTGWHILGRSSSGKSTVLSVVASLNGPPRYVSTWATTAGGIEILAATHNDNVMPLDELGEVDSRALSAMIYMLHSNRGRQRMKADGSMKAVIRFCVTLVSSGEISPADKIRETSGQNPMAGHDVRLISLAIDPARASGVFDGDHEDPEYFAALARRIKSSCSSAFGTAGPAFVEQIVANPEDHLADLRLMKDDFIARHLPPGASGQVSRVLSKFAFVSSAGELGILDGILPFKPGRCDEAAARLFKAWVAARGGSGAAEDREAIKRIRNFIEAHSASRFEHIDAIDVSWRAQYLAGYRDGSEVFFFTDAAFSEALAGLDIRASAEALSRAGFLVRNDGKHFKCKVSTPKGRQRLYKILGAILDFDDGI